MFLRRREEICEHGGGGGDDGTAAAGALDDAGHGDARVIQGRNTGKQAVIGIGGEHLRGTRFTADGNTQIRHGSEEASQARTFADHLLHALLDSGHRIGAHGYVTDVTDRLALHDLAAAEIDHRVKQVGGIAITRRDGGGILTDLNGSKEIVRLADGGGQRIGRRPFGIADGVTPCGAGKNTD